VLYNVTTLFQQPLARKTAEDVAIGHDRDHKRPLNIYYVAAAYYLIHTEKFEMLRFCNGSATLWLDGLNGVTEFIQKSAILAGEHGYDFDNWTIRTTCFNSSCNGQT
jgi:hypothetical protein